GHAECGAPEEAMARRRGHGRAAGDPARRPGVPHHEAQQLEAANDHDVAISRSHVALPRQPQEVVSRSADVSRPEMEYKSVGTLRWARPTTSGRPPPVERPATMGQICCVPLYEYTCRACASDFEQLVRRAEAPSCPTCG